MYGSLAIIFSNGLPNILRNSFKALEVTSNGVLSIQSVEKVRRRVQEQLEQDLALLRHVSDFIIDVSQWAINGDDWRPNEPDLSLYPACDIQHEQAFWKGHQDQVIHRSSSLLAALSEASASRLSASTGS